MGMKRLTYSRQVVVGAELQTDHAVYFVASGGEHEHGRRRQAADGFEYIQAVDAWEHPVEDDQVGRCARMQPHPGLPIFGQQHLMTCSG
jgi:hypothetical protein